MTKANPNQVVLDGQRRVEKRVYEIGAIRGSSHLAFVEQAELKTWCVSRTIVITKIKAS